MMGILNCGNFVTQEVEETGFRDLFIRDKSRVCGLDMRKSQAWNVRVVSS